jgi:PTH1 family peptidyl-tRNA hydrolase
MKAVVGLGNPGAEHAGTRHNTGFRVLSALVPLLPDASSSGRKKHYRYSVHLFAGEELLLVRPTTYMNRSGYAVRALVRGYPGLDLKDLLVVCDDLSLPLGRIRLRPGGSSGGHRGLESIGNMMETSDFPRLRLGIRPAQREFVPGVDYVDFVLSPFEKDEEPIAEEMVQTAARAITSWVGKGLDWTMSAYNA